MTSLKKYFSFTDKKQIWRLLISETNKLVIETRDVDNKQAYYSCYNLENGKLLFKEFQFDEKFWLGIEEVNNDLIYLHKFAKPDLPWHKGITAFSITKKKILWANSEMSFLFSAEDDIYAYKNNFDGKEYFLLDGESGDVKKELGGDFSYVNQKKEEHEKDFSNYIFPEIAESSLQATGIFLKEKEENNISGYIYSAEKNGLLFINYHIAEEGGALTNIIKIIEINRERVIFKETLNKKIKVYIPDSFFIKDDFLFLLKEKEIVLVYKIF
ncbi:MAG: DUF4905 domain-containing protein [Ignavibacteriaceae bacterium]|nr:DUF4905 domain-containing protein [Ignavibacteriaceae bacterium]